MRPSLRQRISRVCNWYLFRLKGSPVHDHTRLFMEINHSCLWAHLGPDLFTKLHKIMNDQEDINNLIREHQEAVTEFSHELSEKIKQLKDEGKI